MIRTSRILVGQLSDVGAVVGQGAVGSGKACETEGVSQLYWKIGTGAPPVKTVGYAVSN